MKKTLVLGIGSAGADICKDVVDRIENEWGSLDRIPWIRVAAFETEPIDGHPLNRTGNQMIHRVTFSANDVDMLKKDSGAQLETEMRLSEFFDPAVAKVVAPGMPGAGNKRMLGMLLCMMADNLKQFEKIVTNNLKELINLNPTAANAALGTFHDGTVPNLQFNDTIDIFLCGSLTGGTASGSAIHLGYLLRDIIKQQKWPAQVIALLGMPNPAFPVAQRKANAYAFLTELNHFHRDGSKYHQVFNLPARPVIEFEAWPPFQEVFIGMPRLGVDAAEPAMKLNDSFGEFIYICATSKAGPALAQQLVNPNIQCATSAFSDGSPQTFAALGVAVIEFPATHIMCACTTRLASEALDEWRHTDLVDSKLPALILGTLRLTDDELCKRLTQAKDDTSPSFDIVSRMLSQNIRDARASKTDAVAKLKSGYAEINALSDNKTAAGAPLKDLIDYNFNNNEKEKIVKDLKEFFEGAIVDLERGPAYCALVLEGILKQCNALEEEAKEHSDLMIAAGSRMDKAIVFVKEAQSSLFLRLLGWRGTALSYWIDAYRISAQGYWEHKKHVECLSYKLKLIGNLKKTADTLLTRITDPSWGIQSWVLRMIGQLNEEYNKLDYTGPSVNGKALFEPGKTVADYYMPAIENSRNVIPDPALAMRFDKNDRYARAYLISHWKWIAGQLTGEASDFDKALATTGGNEKSVIGSEVDTIRAIGRPIFQSLYNVSAVDLVMNPQLGDKANTIIAEVSLDAMPFLDISYNGNPLGKPDSDDPRAPSYAFFKGAESDRPVAQRLRKMLKSVQPNGATPIAYIEELDFAHRVVIVRACAAFPLQSIIGINDLRKWYVDLNINRQGLHTNVKIRWKPIMASLQPFEPYIGEFLTGLAIGCIRGVSLDNFKMSIELPGNVVKEIAFPNDLEECAQILLEDDKARRQILEATEKALKVLGAGDVAEQLKRLCEACPTAYRFKYKNLGQFLKVDSNGTETEKWIDPGLCADLIRANTEKWPDLKGAWDAIWGDKPAGSYVCMDDAKIVNLSDDMRKIFPVAGYYCSRCNNFLAFLDAKSSIGKECSKCHYLF